jgi:SAM-dependent methyltransferase
MAPSFHDRGPAEFDDYAADYSAGMENPLKQCLGGDAEYFIEVKVDWLLRDLHYPSPPGGSGGKFRLLDYGCGAGTMLSVLRRRGFSDALAGCDISREMVKETQSRLNSDQAIELRPIDGANAPFDSGEFDVVILSSVLHHVELASRNNVYADALRLLRPKGRVYIFEHNPFNPVTRWVVKHTAIDRNAVLLRPAEVRTGLQAAGAIRSRTSFLMFFPPRWTRCRRLERLLHWLPCGGQYVVAADKASC